MIENYDKDFQKLLKMALIETPHGGVQFGHFLKGTRPIIVLQGKTRVYWSWQERLLDCVWGGVFVALIFNLII
jgi:hypothetical protein